MSPLYASLLPGRALRACCQERTGRCLLGGERAAACASLALLLPRPATVHACATPLQAGPDDH